MLDNQNRTVGCHLMNTDTGMEACTAASAYIKSSTNYSISWKATKGDGIESAIGRLPIFSNEYPNSLSPGFMQFYPLHVTIQKFTKVACRKKYFQRIDYHFRFTRK